MKIKALSDILTIGMHDIIIIGAGVTGACIARELSKYNLKIAVLEKEIECGCGTSKANSGIIHGGYDCKVGSLKAKMNVRGNYLVRQLKETLDLKFEQCGSLVIAFSEEEMEAVQELYERGIASNCEELEIWSKEKLLQEEPNLSKEAVGALYCGVAGIICPFDMTVAFLESAVMNGVEYFGESEVISIEQKHGATSTGADNYYIVKTPTKEFKSKIVINAAGLYADKVANMVGDYDFEILPRKGEYRVFDKNYKNLIKRVCFQAPSKLGKGILVFPSSHGNFMIGPSADEVDDAEDTTITTEGLQTIEEKARKTIPDLNIRTTIRVFAGVRARPSTGDFMIYASKNSQGVIHAGGIESPGLSSAPAIAEMVAELAKTEADKLGLQFEAKNDFKPERKAIKLFAKMTPEEQSESIKKDKAYSNIICRCEVVSEAEIVQAIHRPAGARTVDGIKRRVRPGAGRCQGGFCEPPVLKILARELGVPMEEIQKDRPNSNVVYGKLKGSERKGGDK